MNGITTPRLVLQYQEAVLGVELGYVSRRELRDVRKRLMEEQGKLNRRAEAIRVRREAAAEVARQRRIAEELRQAAIREEARRVRKREAARDRRNRIFSGVCGQGVSEFLRRAWASTAGNPTIRVVSVGGAINGQDDMELTRDIELPRPDTSQAFVTLFFVYEGGAFTEYMIEGGTLTIYRPTVLVGKRMRRQMFRDGISHCVFTPIVAKLEDALKSTESKERATRLKQKIAKLNLLSKEYEAGVPVDNMEVVAKASGFKIIIHDILGKKLFTFNEAGKCGNISFTNTRPNHIDEGKIVLNSDSVKVDVETMRKKWNELQSKKEFYMIEGNLIDNEPRKIRTIEGVFELHDPNKEYFEEMNEIAQVNKCRFNASKHPEVNEFIKAGRIINAWVTPFTDERPTGHIDMPKAYTQFKKCSHYAGFLGVIHQWRTGSFDKQFLEEHIGIYQVRMKSSDPLFNKLGISRRGYFGVEETTHILPSPEILYFMENGVECEIVAGVWGSRTDFDFNEEMLEDKRYAKWSGRLSMEHHSKKYSFHCEKDWAAHLKADYGDDCYYWEDKKLCSVKLPVENVFTTHHILAFITSYVRIQMIEAMKQFKLEQIVKVVLDGIYFRGDVPKCLDWFRPKEITEHGYRGFAWYSDELCEVDWSSKWISGNTLLTGQGGAGKTYKVMTDKCFNRILFVTPQHTLGCDISKKYSVPYTTIHKLIGEGCQPWIADHSYPSVVFIDEVTQISADWIDRVFAMYKDSLIILAGDLDGRQWYQCRNGHPGDFSQVWKPVGVDIVEVAGDRRSRDDKLRKLKIDVRNEMKRVFIDGDTSEVFRMKMWSHKNLPLTKFEDAVKMFHAGDVWIAGTHATSKKLLENDVCSGWYKQGGHVEFEEKEGYDKRGSFTIHSFQGRTIETGKIFVSVNDVFEYAMLYTAISRAVEFSQLVFVSG